MSGGSIFPHRRAVSLSVAFSFSPTALQQPVVAVLQPSVRLLLLSLLLWISVWSEGHDPWTLKMFSSLAMVFSWAHSVRTTINMRTCTPKLIDFWILNYGSIQNIFKKVIISGNWPCLQGIKDRPLNFVGVGLGWMEGFSWAMNIFRCLCCAGLRNSRKSLKYENPITHILYITFPTGLNILADLSI